MTSRGPAGRAATAAAWAAAAAVLVSPPAASAQEASPSSASDAVVARAGEIAELFSATPGDYEMFGSAFRAQVPDAALDRIFVGYHAEHGPVVQTEIIGPFVGGTTVVRYRFADDAAAIMHINLAPMPPYPVEGALIGPAFEMDERPGDAPPAGAASIREPTYPTDSIVPRTRLRLPFDGEWSVFWGGRRLAQNYHRASSGQRYAYDFVITRDGSSHAGDGTRNEDYYCEGEPILAPAAGRVERAVDGIAENTPGEMNAADLLGNHVVIEHRESEFSLFAHLQTGSVGVEVGDELGEGDRVGACGNSGNSTEPHLHYQLQDGPEFGVARSIQAPFQSYVADGERVESGEPVRGQIIARADR